MASPTRPLHAEVVCTEHSVHGGAARAAPGAAQPARACRAPSRPHAWWPRPPCRRPRTRCRARCSCSAPRTCAGRRVPAAVAATGRARPGGRAACAACACACWRARLSEACWAWCLNGPLFGRTGAAPGAAPSAEPPAGGPPRGRARGRSGHRAAVVAAAPGARGAGRARRRRGHGRAAEGARRGRSAGLPAPAARGRRGRRRRAAAHAALHAALHGAPPRGWPAPTCRTPAPARAIIEAEAGWPGGRSGLAAFDRRPPGRAHGRPGGRGRPQVSATFLGMTPIAAAYGPLRVLQTHAMVSAPGAAASEAAGSYCIAHVVQGRRAARPTTARLTCGRGTRAHASGCSLERASATLRGSSAQLVHGRNRVCASYALQAAVLGRAWKVGCCLGQGMEGRVLS